MNCWFCDQPLKIRPDEANCFCKTQACHSYYVLYVFNRMGCDIPYKVQLIGTLWNWKLTSEPRKYIIDYMYENQVMVITEEIDLPRDPDDESPYIKRDYKKVLRLPYTNGKPILTPLNFKTKLPTILTFS